MERTQADILFEQFNATVEKWMGYLDDYTLETLCQKPNIQSWSLGQVYVHIMADTRFFVEQMSVCLLDDSNKEEMMHDDAKAMFARNSFPDTPLENPSNDINSRQPASKEELLQGLLAIKDEVNSLHSTYDLSRSTGKTKHPGLGFFNALEWLQFAEMHMRHHFRQKKRIDERVSL